MKHRNLSLRIVQEIKYYWPYLRYSSICTLKSEVAGSWLNWFWWILDPLLYMVVYSFISMIVFKAKQEYYQIYIIIGVVTWNFFNRVLIASTRLVKNNVPVLSRMYVPKYIFLLQTVLVNLIKLFISYGLVGLMMILWKVPLTIYIFCILPYTLLLVLVVLGLGLFLMHIGVYASDVTNVMSVILRIVFYLSGIFYNIKQNVPAPFNQIIAWCNPAYIVIEGLREGLLYGRFTNISVLLTWYAISIMLIVVGLLVIYRYENEYAKVS